MHASETGRSLHDRARSALSARRISPPPPPSVTAAGVPPLPDGAAQGEHPGARVSMPETIFGEACQQPQFAKSDVRRSRRMTVTPACDPRSTASCGRGRPANRRGRVVSHGGRLTGRVRGCRWQRLCRRLCGPGRRAGGRQKSLMGSRGPGDAPGWPGRAPHTEDHHRRPRAAASPRRPGHPDHAPPAADGEGEVAGQNLLRGHLTDGDPGQPAQLAAILRGH
jgi:hypothetical protein